MVKVWEVVIIFGSFFRMSKILLGYVPKINILHQFINKVLIQLSSVK